MPEKVEEGKPERKKGLVTERDKILRMKYSRQMKRCMNQNKSFWKDEVAFYLDGVSFVFKHNPLNSAIAPKARVWRKMSEGFCTPINPYFCIQFNYLAPL
jgi:hypothetical protein